MVNFKKIVAGCMLSTLALSSTAFASEISSSDYSSNKIVSENVVLGAHTHHLHAVSKNGGGVAYAKKINKWAPDTTVASVSLSQTGTKGSESFVASHYTSDGEVQSYYIKFSPSKSSSVFGISIAHKKYY